MAVEETIGNRKMCLYTGFAVVLFFTLFTNVQSQLPEKLTQNPCVSKTTCRECIQTKSCAWCMQPEFDDKPRCFQPSLSSLLGSCPEEYTWNPDIQERLVIAEQLTRGVAQSGGGTFVSGGSIEEHGSSSHSEQSHFSSESGGQESMSASGHRKIVQIYPQRVSLKLRLSELKMSQMRLNAN